MQYQVEVGGRVRRVNVQRVDGRFTVTVDGREHIVDAQRVDASTMSLLIERGGASRGEVRLKADGTDEALAPPPATKATATTPARGVTNSYTVTFATDPPERR